jgi:hypothetical protein
LLAVQWPFAEFLVHSPLARTPFFAADSWNYDNQLGDWRYEFWGAPLTPTGTVALNILGIGLLKAMAQAAFMTRIGIAFGSWLAVVRR